MLIEAAMRFYLITIQMAEQVTTKGGDDVGREAALTLLEACKPVQPPWKSVWRFLQKFEKKTTIQSSGITPWYIPRGL